MVKVHSTDANGNKKVHLFKYVFKAIDFCEHVNLRGGNAIIVSNTNTRNLKIKRKRKRKKKMSIKSLRAHAKRCGCVVKKKKRTKRRYKRRY